MLTPFLFNLLGTKFALSALPGCFRNVGGVGRAVTVLDGSNLPDECAVSIPRQKQMANSSSRYHTRKDFNSYTNHSVGRLRQTPVEGGLSVKLTFIIIVAR